MHAALAPSPAGHVPSGSWWARGERLADSGRARPGLYVLVITPDLIASAHRLDAVLDRRQGVAPHDSQTSRGGLKSIGGQRRVTYCRYLLLFRAHGHARRPLQI